MFKPLIAVSRPVRDRYNKTAEDITPGNFFFYSFGVFLVENPSNLLAASHVKDNGQWPRQGTRTLEMCNLVLKSIKLLLKIEVHYVLFWTTRQVFPERREL